MAAVAEASQAGRLANVSAALLLVDPVAEGRREERVQILTRLFEEVNLIAATSEGPIAAIVSALESASEPRVLVVAEDHDLFLADVLLALTAWPEAAVVAPRREGLGEPLCALYRVEEALPSARRLEKEGGRDLHAWMDTFECGNLEGEDLIALLPPDGSAALRRLSPET